MSARMPDVVVFDIGGVLLDWDPRHLYRKLFAGSEADMEWFLAQVCSPAWNLAQDEGRPWDEGVAMLIAEHPGHEANIRAYRDRWPEMVAGPITGTVDLLQELHDGGVPLYAVTNFAGDTFRYAQETYPFLGLFRDVAVSGDERMLKPDRRIFDLLAERNGVAHERMVFIDDSEKNVVGARAAGLHAIHFTGPDALRKELTALGFNQLAG